MRYFHTIHSSDEKAVFAHQIYRLGDRAGGAVVDGEHAVLQLAGFHCGKDLFKCGIKLNRSAGEKCLGSSFGICPLGALTADAYRGVHLGRFQFRLRLCGEKHFLLQLRADAHHVGKHGAGSSTQSRTGILFYPIQHLLFPVCLEHLHVVRLLISCYILTQQHPLFKQRLQFFVQFVDFVSNFIQFHM